jgi:translation initiation factor 2 alpha subunit (eIF-2alpha)
MKLPDYVILDTRNLVKFLRTKIKALIEIEVTEEDVLETIFEAMSYDNSNTNLNIDASCQCAARYHLGAAFAQDADDTAEAMSEFASKIYSDLKRLNAYRNGYLFYQFVQLLGNDILLTRLELPEC